MTGKCTKCNRSRTKDSSSNSSSGSSYDFTDNSVADCDSSSSSSSSSSSGCEKCQYRKPKGCQAGACDYDCEGGCEGNCDDGCNQCEPGYSDYESDDCGVSDCSSDSSSDDSCMESSDYSKCSDFDSSSMYSSDRKHSRSKKKKISKLNQRTRVDESKSGTNYQVSFVDSSTHPWNTDKKRGKSVAVNGVNGPTIHLYRGIGYNFNVENPKDGNFIITDTPYTNVNSKPVAGFSKNGSSYSFTPTDKHKRIMFYHNTRFATGGGPVVLHKNH